jgi:phage terminase large subunit GpA-like protein
MQFVIEADVTCPHCGETFPLQIDTSEAQQTLIEDCTVCCRPMTLTISCQPGEVLAVGMEE